MVFGPPVNSQFWQNWYEMDSNELVRVLGGWSASSGPLYRQLATALHGAILRGDLPSGSRLPPERTLADALAVSRSTVVAAYDLLRAEAIVESRQGSGTRVRQGIAARSLPRDVALPRLSARNTLLDLASPGPANVIDLSRGSPGIPQGFGPEDFALSPDELAQLMAGDVYQAQGTPALRRALADHYTRNGLPTNEAQILITSGAQQAISLLAGLYLQRGDSVLLENPTYVGAIDAFRNAGARLIPVNVDDDGPRVDVLRGLAASSFPQLIYVVATYQNPTGACIPASRRHELASVAAELGVPVATDDTLAWMDLDTPAPPTLATYGSGGTIITIGSLSKLFWGGLRIGWVRGPEAVINRLTRLRVVDDLGSTPFTQAIATRLIPHWDRAKESRRAEFRPKLDLMCAMLLSYCRRGAGASRRAAFSCGSSFRWAIAASSPRWRYATACW